MYPELFMHSGSVQIINSFTTTIFLVVVLFIILNQCFVRNLLLCEVKLMDPIIRIFTSTWAPGVKNLFLLISICEETVNDIDCFKIECFMSVNENKLTIYNEYSIPSQICDISTDEIIEAIKNYKKINLITNEICNSPDMLTAAYLVYKLDDFKLVEIDKIFLKEYENAYPGVLDKIHNKTGNEKLKQIIICIKNMKFKEEKI